MKIAVQKLNANGITISKELLEKSLLKYNSIFSNESYKLYDLGYISSPSEFNKSEFLKAVYQQFPNSKDLLISNITGELVLDSDLISYAILKLNNKEFSVVMESFKKIVESNEAIENLSSLYTKLSIKKKTSVVIKPRLSVSNTLADYSTYKLDGFGIMDCFERQEDTHLVKVCINEILLKYLCFEVGISEDCYNKYKLTGKSFFIDGLTAGQELNFINYLLNGVIKPDGKFGKELEDVLLSYYSKLFSSNNPRFSCDKFEATIFIKALDEVLMYTKAERAKIESIGGSELYVTDKEIIFEVPNIISEKNWSCFNDNKLMVGNYVMDYVTHEELSKCNNLLGICGEYIKKSDVEELGYFPLCQPVKLHYMSKSGAKLKDSTFEYYPISRVLYNDDKDENGNYVSRSLVPVILEDFVISFSDISSVYNKFGVSNKNELFKSIRKNLVQTFTVDTSIVTYTNLITDLVCALIYADCGYPDYDLVMDNYMFITDDIYNKACFEAEEVYKEISARLN